VTGVSVKAARFADHWKCGRAALLAGLLHDLGKYDPDFQLRLRAKAGGGLGVVMGKRANEVGVWELPRLPRI
jgi:hypothetical protein